MRVPEDYKKPTTSENSSRGQNSDQGSKQETRHSSTKAKADCGKVVVSPAKNKDKSRHKRKDAPIAMYKPKQLLLAAAPSTEAREDSLAEAAVQDEEKDFIKEPKKNRPTPENLAETVDRSRPTQ